MDWKNLTPLLEAKLDPAAVKDRQLGGKKISYIEGWHAIAEANRIFGFNGWSCKTIYCNEVCRYQLAKKDGKLAVDTSFNNWSVGYEAKVRVTVDGVVREGTGHGNGTMGDLYAAIESASKEAETDAFKRAIRTFGNPFGLPLYDKLQANVDTPAAKEKPVTKTPENPSEKKQPIEVNLSEEKKQASTVSEAVMMIEKHMQLYSSRNMRESVYKANSHITDLLSKLSGGNSQRAFEALALLDRLHIVLDAPNAA